MNNMDFTAGGLGTFTRSGFTYSQNMRQNEWAGATFSPDGKWLFVNIQTPGMTFAITGPWVWL
jgi:secreted PhoX family phosphatase